MSTPHTLPMERTARHSDVDLFLWAPVGHYRAAANGDLLTVNRKTVELLGYASESELLQCNIEHDLCFDEEARRKLHSCLMGQGPLQQWETRWKRKDGTPMWVELTVRAVRDVQGELQEFEGFVRDVSVQKEIEQEFRQTSELLRAIIMSSPLAISVLDLDGNILLVNPAYERMFQWTFEELLGKNPPIVPEETREEYEGLFHSTKHGKSYYDYETERRRRDGTLVHVSLYTSPLYDVHGMINGIVAMFIDIEDKKKAERALYDSQNRYRELFENSITGNFVSTPDGKILECNPAFARIYGFSSVEEALTCNPEMLYPHPHDRQQFLDDLRRQKKIEYSESIGRRIDGRLIYLVGNVMGKFDEQGNLVEIVGYLMDITERKMLEQQLLQAQKMESIGTLVSGIAHDYNNILNNILGFASQIKKYSHDAHRVLRYASTIEKSASRGAELASQLLSFARKKDRGGERVDLREVVEELILLASETFPKTITVETIVDPALKPVLGNQGELHQALLNLCLNAVDAIKARPERSGYGVLRLELKNKEEEAEFSALRSDAEQKCAEPWVEIILSDDGIGIPKEIQSRVFDPFFTTKEQGEGTGLGLTIVYNIIANHKGILTFESEAGRGTTFRLLLPALQHGTSQNQKTVSPGNASSSNKVILLADDEEPMQEIGRELLEEQGYTVLIARDGQEAVEMFRSRAHEIDLVILDLVMPRLDGGQAYLEMKKIKDDLRALFCTGYATDELIKSLLQQENLKALRKPFRTAEFISVVNELLVS